MARLNIQLRDDLDERFRKEAGKRFGVKKGSLRKAVEEALELWIKQTKP